MTQEEAIEYLNTLYMALAVFPNQQIPLGDIGKMKESVSMAIKALQLIPDIETVLHDSSYITNDEYEDEVIEVELIQRILNKVKEEVIL